jgi:endonuclease IV
MFGVHVNKKSGSRNRDMDIAITEDMKRMKDYGVVTPCAQIFVAGPRNYAPTITPAVAEKIKNLGFPTSVHGAYVDKPWSGSAQAIGNIKREMDLARLCGASGVVVHLGSASATPTFIDAVRAITAGDGPLLWLEIQAAKPSPLTYETPEKLQALFKRLEDAGCARRIGLCIDTAHLYSCGTSLRTYAHAKAWFAGIRDITTRYPIMIHLNDSERELGCGVDKHAAICHGTIWREYIDDISESGLAYIIKFAKKRGIHMIFERHDDDVCKDLRVLSHNKVV